MDFYIHIYTYIKIEKLLNYSTLEGTYKSSHSSLKSESPIQVNFLETGMTSCDLSPMRDNGPGTVQYALMHSSLCQTLLKKILLTIRLTINSVLKPFEAK